MADEIYLTNDGAKTLRAELEQLKGPKRSELAQRLRSAIQMGDLSENADYKQAKDDQGFLEGRIQEIEYLLKNAIIIERAASRDVVGIGNRVTIEEDGSPPETYHIVGAKEAERGQVAVA